MDIRTISTASRIAAAVSRRGSLRLLGGAALAGAVTGPTATRAGKAGKKAKQRCKRQRGDCLASIREFCAPKSEPEDCEALNGRCCEYFATCKAGEGVACLLEGPIG